MNTANTICVLSRNLRRLFEPVALWLFPKCFERISAGNAVSTARTG